jgi:hypothetical protein
MFDLEDLRRRTFGHKKYAYDPVVSALIAMTQTKQRTNIPEPVREGGSLHCAIVHDGRCLS